MVNVSMTFGVIKICIYYSSLSSYELECDNGFFETQIQTPKFFKFHVSSWQVVPVHTCTYIQKQQGLFCHCYLHATCELKVISFFNNFNLLSQSARFDMVFKS